MARSSPIDGDKNDKRSHLTSPIPLDFPHVSYGVSGGRKLTLIIAVLALTGANL